MKKSTIMTPSFLIIQKNICKAIFLALLFSIPSLASAFDYYWVNGSGNWSEYSTHWAKVPNPGGPIDFHSNVPTTGDDVFFTNNGGTAYTVFVDASTTVPKCRNMNWTTAPNGVILDGSAIGRLDIYGSVVLNSNMSIIFPGGIHFIAFGSASTITSNGVHFPTEVYFEGTTGSWMLNDALFVDVYLTHNGGTLMTNDQTVTVGSSSPYSRFSGESPGILHLGDSDFIINGGPAYFRYAPADFNAGTSHVICNSGQSVEGIVNAPTTSHFYDVTFTHYNPVGFYFGSVDGTLTFQGTGQIHGYVYYALPPVLNNVIFQEDGYIYDAFDYGHLTLTAGKTYTFRDYPGGANGSGQTILPGGTITANSGIACNNFIYLKSLQFGTSVDFINNSGNDITVTGVTLEDIHATGSNALICNYGLNVSNNTGWTFTNQCPAISLYWIGGAGDWDDYAHWSTTSGGTTCDCLPSAATNVFFDANSGFSTGNNTVTVAGEAFCADMDCTGVIGMPSINGIIAPNGTGGVLNIYGSVVFALPTEMTYNMPGGTYFRAAGAETITSARQNYGKVTFEGNGSWNITDSLKVLETVHHYDGTIYTLGNPIVCRYWLGNWQSAVSGGYADKGAELWLGVVNGASSTVTLRENLYGKFYASYEVGKFHAVQSHIVGEGGGYISTENKNHDFWDVTFTPGAHAGSFVNGNILHKLTYLSGANLLGNNTTIHEAEFHSGGYIFDNHIFDILTIYGGKTYKIEGSLGGNATQTITASGNLNLVNVSCEDPVYLFAPNPGQIATIRKEGSGTTLALHDAILDNVFPDLSTGATYSAVNSVAIQPAVETAWNMVNGPARSLHWVGGAGDWHNTAHWSLTSGGAGGECPPTPQDDVFFDTGSGLGGAAVTVSQKFAFCKNMEWTGVGSGALFDNTTNGNNTDIFSGNNIAVFGNLTFASNMVNDFGGSVFMRGSQPSTITSAGIHFKHRLLFWDPAGDWSLSDDLWVDFEVQHYYGKVTTNNHNIKVGYNWGNYPPGNTAELFLGTTTMTILSNIVGDASERGYGVFYYQPSKFHGESSNIVFEDNLRGALLVYYDNLEFHNITFKAPISAMDKGIVNNKLVFEKTGSIGGWGDIHDAEFHDDLTFNDSRNFHKITFYPGKYYTILSGRTIGIVPDNGNEGQFIAQGLPDQYIEIKSSQPSAPAFVHMDDIDGGTTCTHYLFLTGMTHTGTEDIYVPTPGGNVFNNSGWQFFPCNPCPATIPVLDPASLTVVCVPGQAKLILAGLEPNETANWYTDPAAVVADTVYSDGNLFEPNITAPTTFYARVYSDGGQCESTVILTVNITTNATFPTVFNVSGSGGTFCSGNIGTTIGLDGSETGVDYQLLVGGNPTGPPVGGTGAAISFGTQNSSGTYTVLAFVAGASCDVNMTGSVTLSIDPAPAVDATSNDLVCLGNGPLQFMESGGEAVSWDWNGPAGFVSTDQNPVIAYPNYSNIGTYTVVVTGTNGCTNSDAVAFAFSSTPVALCQDIVVTLNETGQAIITPGQIDDGSYDNCGPVWLTLSHDCFYCNQTGPNNVTLTVTNIGGASATCMAVVTVADYLVIDDILVTPTACPGTSVGTITVEASTPFPAYHQLIYSIDGGATWANTNLFSNLPEGTYDVGVQILNAALCQASDMATVPGPAQVNTWNNLGDGLHWSDPANWSEGIVPLPCQDVVIPGFSNVLVQMGFEGVGRTLEVMLDAVLTVDGLMDIKN